MIAKELPDIPTEQAEVSEKIYETHLSAERKTWKLPWCAQAGTDNRNDKRKYVDRFEEQANIQLFSSRYLWSAYPALIINVAVHVWNLLAEKLRTQN